MQETCGRARNGYRRLVELSPDGIAIHCKGLFSLSIPPAHVFSVRHGRSTDQPVDLATSCIRLPGLWCARGCSS
jgi:hypothetical protein